MIFEPLVYVLYVYIVCITLFMYYAFWPICHTSNASLKSIKLTLVLKREHLQAFLLFWEERKCFVISTWRSHNCHLPPSLLLPIVPFYPDMPTQQHSNSVDWYDMTAAQFPQFLLNVLIIKETSREKLLQTQIKIGCCNCIFFCIYIFILSGPHTW